MGRSSRLLAGNLGPPQLEWLERRRLARTLCFLEVLAGTSHCVASTPSGPCHRLHSGYWSPSGPSLPLGSPRRQRSPHLPQPWSSTLWGLVSPEGVLELMPAAQAWWLLAAARLGAAGLGRERRFLGRVPHPPALPPLILASCLPRASLRRPARLLSAHAARWSLRPSVPDGRAEPERSGLPAASGAGAGDDARGLEQSRPVTQAKVLSAWHESVQGQAGKSLFQEWPPWVGAAVGPMPRTLRLLLFLLGVSPPSACPRPLAALPPGHH